MLDSSRVKVLLIGFLDSPHFARWVELVLLNTSYSIILFSSSPSRRMNSKLQKLIYAGDGRIELSPFSPKRPWLTSLFDLIPGVNIRRRRLGNCLNTEKLAAVHFFEMQLSGYLVSGLPKDPNVKYVYSNYGSDINWYRQYERHVKKIRRALSLVDLIFYECERDLSFMKRATSKRSLYVKTINSGGLPEPNYSLNQDRNKILIKGYSNKWGMALWTLFRLSKIRNELPENLSVELYSCNFHVPIIAKLWGLINKIEVRTHLKGKLTHDQTLLLFENAIMHIAISRSDGIPSSTMEAMRGGAIPVQSNTACLSDWIENGRNGFLIEIDRHALWNAVTRIVHDSRFTTEARQLNYQAIDEKHNRKAVGRLAADAYRQLLGD